MDEIKQWLNGNGDWDTGVDLVLKHSTNRMLHQVFLEGQTPYKVARLRKELAHLLTAKKTVAVQTKQVQETAKKTVLEIVTNAPKGWGPVDRMDPVVLALHTQWKPLFLEMVDLQSRLHDMAQRGTSDPAAKQEAGRMAHRILDLDDQCDDLYFKRDHFRANGALPAIQPPPDDLVTDPKKMPVALENAKRYVRQYRAKLEKDPTSEKNAQQLAKWEQRVQHYQNILNG